MVLITTRTLLKGKNTDNSRKARRDRCIGTSSVSSSPSSVTSTLSFSVEGDLEKLVWPSRRKDCEWMAGKVDLGGSAAGASQRSLASRISSASPSPSKARRERCKSRKKYAAKTIASPSTPIVTEKTTRQPLADITLEKRLNQNIGRESRPARTISPGWHRALRNLLSQAAKERVGPAASP